jgi:GntR family phosphonate transport system transcriptional regulator
MEKGVDFRRNTGRPLWRWIQDDIAGRIRMGQIAPGDRLPTEHAYADHYGVNRHTVRQAIAGLVEMGLVRVEQGRGTFAREPVLAYPLSRDTRFCAIAGAEGRVSRMVLLLHGVEDADRATADALDLPYGAPVTRLEVAGELDGHRVYVSTIRLPRDRFPGIVEAFQEAGSIALALSALGVKETERQATNIAARLPCPADAQALNQPRNRPVLVAESVNTDRAGQPVEYTLTRFASDWITMVVKPEIKLP